MDKQKKIDLQEFLARARALREKTAGYVISDEELANAKREGRLEQLVTVNKKLRNEN